MLRVDHILQNPNAPVDNVLLGTAPRRQFLAALTQLGDEIRAFGLADPIADLITTWHQNFTNCVRREADLVAARTAFTEQLQEILKDPLYDISVDEHPLLGSDGNLYSHKTLSLYFYQNEAAEPFRSPLAPQDEQPFFVTPHPVAKRMVAWLQEQHAYTPIPEELQRAYVEAEAQGPLFLPTRELYLQREPAAAADPVQLARDQLAILMRRRLLPELNQLEERLRQFPGQDPLTRGANIWLRRYREAFFGAEDLAALQAHHFDALQILLLGTPAPYAPHSVVRLLIDHLRQNDIPLSDPLQQLDRQHAPRLTHAERVARMRARQEEQVAEIQREVARRAREEEEADQRFLEQLQAVAQEREAQQQAANDEVEVFAQQLGDQLEENLDQLNHQFVNRRDHLRQQLENEAQGYAQANERTDRQLTHLEGRVRELTLELRQTVARLPEAERGQKQLEQAIAETQIAICQRQRKQSSSILSSLLLGVAAIAGTVATCGLLPAGMSAAIGPKSIALAIAI